MKLWIIAVIALLVAPLSGCLAADPKETVGGPAIPDAAAPAGFDENTGGIEGGVFDEENAPLPGVQVAVQSATTPVQSTITDVAGRFTFSNLAPATYQVFASALGYDSLARSVQVAAGQIATAQFVLIKISVVHAYSETLLFKGFFDCTWVYSLVLVGASGPCGYTNVNGTTGNPLEPWWVNSKRKWNYPVGPGVMSVLHDLTWTQGSLATGEKTSVIMSHGPLPDGTTRDGLHRYCFATGTNPVKLHWEREQLDDDGDCLTGTAQVGGNIPGPPTIDPAGMTLQSFVSTGAGANPIGGDLPVGLAYQQPFDLYVSVFYGEVAPEGYTALVDE